MAGDIMRHKSCDVRHFNIVFKVVSEEFNVAISENYVLSNDPYSTSV